MGGLFNVNTLRMHRITPVQDGKLNNLDSPRLLNKL